MKKSLIKSKKLEIYFWKNSVKMIIDRENKETYPDQITGYISNRLYGDISWLTGDINSELFGNINSELFGNISGINGNINSGLFGNISGLFGDCTKITGNIDFCELTEKDRKTGIDINNLVKD